MLGERNRETEWMCHMTKEGERRGSAAEWGKIGKRGWEEERKGIQIAGEVVSVKDTLAGKGLGKGGEGWGEIISVGTGCMLCHKI